IFNGHVVGGGTVSGSTFSGPGFGSGIDLPGSLAVNVRVTGVTVSGCANYGIFLGENDSTVVDGCVVANIGGGVGIEASSVTHSSAYLCGGIGIAADSAADCTASVGGNATGISCRTAHNCNGVSDSGVALDVSRVAIGCNGEAASLPGIALRCGGTA